MDNKGAVYRALVLDANGQTGEVVVAIPNLTGANNRVTLTGLNRHAVDGVWKVPTVGSVVLVGSDDDNGSTLFLIPTFTYDDDVRAINFYGDFEGPVVFVARNDTASTIPAYTVVCGQADGGELVIAKANANDSAKPALGITVEAIAPNASGKVAVAGVLDGPNTGSLAANINVFVGTTGNIVSTPVGLSYPQVVAKVLTVGNPGSLLVTIKDLLSTSGSYSGVFTGTIYATAGNIGGASSGWVIDSNRLESRGTTQKIVLDGQDGEIYIGTYGSGTYNSASTPFYVNKSGYFSLSNKLTFNPITSTLDVNGTVTADAGAIGGWTIGANKLSAGTGSSSVALASSGGYAIFAGASSPGAATFKVSDTGYLTASGVDLSGRLVATSGSIGGWSITSGSISSSGSTPIVLNSDGKITVGNTNWANSANGFYVDNTGKFGLGSKLTWDNTNLTVDGTITAASGVIGGWSIDNTRLYAGTGSNFIAMSSDNAIEYRTWAGHPTPASAPFFITKGGGLYASNACITGAIVATSGSFTGSITSASISGSSITGGSISGGYITGGSISGGYITGGSINGGRITGGSISGAVVTAGSISGNSITGSSISGTTITAGSISGNTITGGSISGAVVTAGSISGNSITGSSISGTTITAGSISGNTITGGSISGAVVTAGSISGNTITGGSISGAVVTAGSISGNTITGSSISGTSITAGSISGNTITGGSISGAVVTAGSISGNSITGSSISGTTITAGSISGNSITGGSISGAVVTAGSISGNTITGSSISGTTITAGSISGNTITGGSISGNSITGSSISGATITGGSISGGYITAGSFSGGSISGGYITGASISAGSLSGASISGGQISIGSNFSVTNSGNLSASNASITGAITATSGSFTGTITATTGAIGGWSLASNEIYKDTSGSSNTYRTGVYSGTGSSVDPSKFYMVTNASTALSAPAHASSTTPFYVDSNGRFSITDKLYFDPSDAQSFGTLTVIGRIRGAIENTPIIPTDSGSFGVTSVTISGTTPNQTGVLTTGASTHTFAVGDTVIVESLSGAASAVNGAWAISAKTTSTFTVTGVSGATNGTYSTAGSARVRELTLGLHPAFNGSPAGLGIRLDENNYWFVNNKFRIGSSGSFVSWDGATLETSGKITAQSGSIGGYSIGASALTAGTGSSAVGVGTAGYPFWAGSTTASAAQFRVTDTGTLFASNASITGYVNATSGSFSGAISAASISGSTITGGSITGGSISGSYITAGSFSGGSISGTTITAGSISGAYITAGSLSGASISGGSITIGSNFSVNTAGSLTASGASITGNIVATSGSFTGTITATTGAIGGFTLSGNTLTSGTGASSVGVASSGGYPFWAGSTTSSAAPFRVTDTGALVASNASITGNIVATSGSFTGTLTATSGSIGGWAIGGNSLTFGTGSSAVGIASLGGYPFWAGSTTASAAPFRVTDTGAFVATNGSFTGTITATTGAIGGWTIGSTTLTGISGNSNFGLASNASPHYVYAGRDPYLKLTGASNSIAWTADYAALRFAGDIEFVVRAAADDWTAGPSGVPRFIAKFTTGASNFGYEFYINASGNLALQWGTSASSALSATALANVPFGDKTTYWFKATLDVDNGASGNTVSFYYAPDSVTEPTSWTLIYNAVQSGVTSLYTGHSSVDLLVGGRGSRAGSTSAGTPFAGRIYRAIIRNGIGGSTVYDSNFFAQSTGATSFTESAAGATVTLLSGATIPYTDYKFKVRNGGEVEASQFSLVNAVGDVIGKFGALASPGYTSTSSTLGDLFYTYDTALLMPSAASSTWNAGGLGWGAADSSNQNHVTALLSYNSTSSSTSPARLAAVSVFGTTGASNDGNAVYIDSGKYQTSSSSSGYAYMTMNTWSPSSFNSGGSASGPLPVINLATSYIRQGSGSASANLYNYYGYLYNARGTFSLTANTTVTGASPYTTAAGLATDASANLSVSAQGSTVTGASTTSTYAMMTMASAGTAGFGSYELISTSASNLYTYSQLAHSKDVSTWTWNTGGSAQITHSWNQGPWPQQPTFYSGFWNADFNGTSGSNGYVLLHNKTGTQTFISTHSSAGAVWIRPANNATSGQVTFTSTATTLTAASLNLNPTSGVYLNGTAAKMMTYASYAAGGSATLTTTVSDGATLTLAANAGDILVVDGTFDMTIGTTLSQGLGTLVVNGTTVGTSVVLGSTFAGAPAPLRQSGSITYTQAFGSTSAAHVVKLQHKLNTAATGVTANTSSIRVMVYATK